MEKKMNPTTTNVDLTLNQISELLMASEFVSWENPDFTSAVTRLTQAKWSLERANETAKAYDYVLKMPDDTLHLSDLLPERLQAMLKAYKYLILRLENVHLSQFSGRMTENDQHPKVMVDAGELRRWVELMKYTEDSIVNHNCLPSQFEYVDGVYLESDCTKILGEKAVAYFRQQMEQPEVSA
jgi:hypothetical protein